MNGLEENEYREGLRSLAFLVRTKAESKGEVPSPKGFIRRNACTKCGHEWNVRVGTPLPKRCPQCATTLWNEKNLKRHVCMCCGHEWAGRHPDPIRCPSCRSRLWAEGPRRYECTGCGATVSRCEGYEAVCESCGCAMRELPIRARRATELIPSMKEELLLAYEMPRNDATAFLKENGFELEDAEAVVRCLRGDLPVEIATDLDLPVGRMLSINSCLRRTLGAEE